MNGSVENGSIRNRIVQALSVIMVISYAALLLACQSPPPTDRMITDATAALKKNPNDTEAYFNRGLAWNKKGAHEWAIEDFNKVLALDPKHAGAYLNRGISWSKKGRYEKAIADFNSALRIDPDNPGIYLNRGIALREKGDPPLSLADLNKAIELSPKSPAAHINRALTLVEMAHFSPAIADYEHAIEWDPKYALAYNNLAYLLATAPDDAVRNGNRAVKLAEKALALRQSIMTLDTLAAAYAETGMFKKAVQLQKEAIYLLRKRGDITLLDELERHLEAYYAGKPWRERPRKCVNDQQGKIGEPTSGLWTPNTNNRLPDTQPEPESHH